MNTKIKCLAWALALSVSIHAQAAEQIAPAKPTCNYQRLGGLTLQGVCNYLQQHLSPDDMWMFNNALSPMHQRELVLAIVKHNATGK